jgi:cation diffusion facilitator family transporter
VSAEGGTRAVLAALGANLGIGATKFLAFALTGSSAMLAESVHSVADSGNQILLLIGGRRARREATEEHPFGYGRARYYYASLVAVVLFSVGGLYALYESRHKFSDPEPIEAWRWVPLVVLGVAMVLESFSLRTAVVESNRVRGGLGWAAFIRRSRSPELPVILLEDVAALLGLVLAFVGVGITLATGDGRWDAGATAAIGVLLVTVALVLGKETKSMLLGESATPEDVALIRSALVASNLGNVIHLRTMHLGPEDVLVAAKVAFPGDTSVETVAALVDAAEERIRAAVTAARLIYIETGVPRKDYP